MSYFGPVTNLHRAITETFSSVSPTLTGVSAAFASAIDARYLGCGP